MANPSRTVKSFKSKDWQYAYKTSSPSPGGKAVNILHDFYIPALNLSVQYDRVAGYFRSSSLAAASQGFSAFTASGGKMRLIAGADFAEEDILAILEGDQHLLARWKEALNFSRGWWLKGISKCASLSGFMGRPESPLPMSTPRTVTCTKSGRCSPTNRGTASVSPGLSMNLEQLSC
ncbi:MAG: hypothetical protein JRJ85_29035 [Deltaproteobacteria bacterium]|nr:hypothetical protein [Deltaproteobacteria bacterium]